MNVSEDVSRVFHKNGNAELRRYYASAESWRRIYSGEPEWKTVKKSGLYRGGTRRMNMLGTAKVLCDRFASGVMAEKPSLVFADEKVGGYVRRVFDESGFMAKLAECLPYAFAMGGCVFRPYINSGKIGIDIVIGGSFVPLEWDGNGITAACFRSSLVRNGSRYTLLEKRGNEGGTAVSEHRLFCAKDGAAYEASAECSLSEVYPELKTRVEYDGVDSKLFSVFRVFGANNLYPEIPLGISVFANALDTLRALDVAFDSFAREFILGKKRIIVPSSCVQTVVDIATGEQRQYFDADDEAYVALKCDEESELKITDNTVELRVDEHIKAINALLNILCFQTGLSSGTFSFDANEGVKTATEIISRDSRTAETVRVQQSALGGAIAELVREIALLGEYLGEIEKSDTTVEVLWQDGIITDENTLIENSVKLVQSGLKSRVTAIMELQRCSYGDAVKEYERIMKEERGN